MAQPRQVNDNCRKRGSGVLAASAMLVPLQWFFRSFAQVRTA